MLQYARTDTHYLLYIYDCVRAQLLDFNHGQPGLLQCVWNKSKDISLKVSPDLTSCITKIKLTPKYTPILLLLSPLFNSFPVSFIAFIFLHFHSIISCVCWHLSQFSLCLPLLCRNMWSLYTQKSHIWSCRGSRKGLLTPSSSLPSDCCLPGGTSWPGRRMKAQGRLCGNGWTCCSDNLLEQFFLFLVNAQDRSRNHPCSCDNIPSFRIILSLLKSVWTCFNTALFVFFRYVLPSHMMSKISEELPKWVD